MAKTITDIRNPKNTAAWVGLVGRVVQALAKDNRKMSEIPPGRLRIFFKTQWHVINLRDA